MKPNPWIVAAYWKCILLLNSPSRSGLHCNCTFTPCRHGTKRREVRYAPCSSTPAAACLPPNTNCIALEERPKYSDQQPAALKGVHPHAWVQGTDSWEGFKALWGNVLLQVVAPCLASNKIRTTILEIAPCEVLPGAPHLQPVHPFFYSLKKKM